MHQVAEDLGQMAGTLFVGERNCHYLLISLNVAEPVFDGALGGAFEDGRDGLYDVGSRRSDRQSLFDRFDQGRNLDRLHQNLIGLQQDGMRSGIHLGEAAQEHRDGLRIGVAHCAYDGEAVTGSRHVEIAEQDIVDVGTDELQRFGHVACRGYVEAFFLQYVIQRQTNEFIIIDQQDIGTQHSVSF